MYLQDWLLKHRMSYNEFAAALNINRLTLYWWIRKKKRPNAKNMDKIKEITKGKVTYEEISTPQVPCETPKD